MRPLLAADEGCVFDLYGEAAAKTTGRAEGEDHGSRELGWRLVRDDDFFVVDPEVEDLGHGR